MLDTPQVMVDIRSKPDCESIGQLHVRLNFDLDKNDESM